MTTTAVRAAAARRRQAVRAGLASVDAVVDATAAREHVAALRRAGIPVVAIADGSGVPVGTVRSVAYGERARVRMSTSAALLRFNPPPAPWHRWRSCVPGIGTRRRLRALQVTGWSLRAIARLTGVQPETLARAAGTAASSSPDGEHFVTAALAVAVRDFYARNDAGPPAPVSRAEKIARSRLARVTAERGWAGPWAWDDDTIDDPEAAPTVGADLPGPGFDEVAVQRCMDGDAPVGTTREDRVEAVRRLAAAGFPDPAIAERVGVTARTVLRYRVAEGIPSGVAV